MLLRVKNGVTRLRRLPARRRSERRMLRFYRQFVRPGSLCFDVGANVGGRTAVFRRLGARRVVAVEPQPACVARLRRRFGSDPDVVVEATGLGPPGATSAELTVADWSTIATMSGPWLERVTESRRFEGARWSDRPLVVPVTTLDALVERHGEPDFCKIDVEGFELEVLRGLSRALPALSFEFTPEYGDAAVACVRHLAGLGMRRYALSLGESMELEVGWTDAGGMISALRARTGGPSGDVYARRA